MGAQWWPQLMTPVLAPVAGPDRLGRRSAAAAARQSVRDVAGGRGRVMPGDRFSRTSWAVGTVNQDPATMNLGGSGPVTGMQMAFPNTSGPVESPEGYSGRTVNAVVEAAIGAGRL